MATRWDKARGLGIEISGSRTDYRTTCPACSPHRNKRKDPCLHVTVEADAVRYFCHHCNDFKGMLTDDDVRSDYAAPGGSRPGRGAGRPAGHRQRPARWY